MRVATYTQPTIAARGSLAALIILALTVMLGTSALHTLMTHFAPQLHSGIALLWLLTYLAAFMGLMFNHGINWISWLARYRILLVILLLGTTVSVSWSLDAIVSAERVVHLLGSSVLAIYIGFMVPLLSILRITAVIMAVIMLASIAFAIGMPSVGMEEYEGKIVWSGILNSKNALGFWAAVAVLLFITLSASSNSLFMKLMCYAMAGASLFVLVKSESATSLLAMLVAGALSLYIYIAFRFQLGFIRMVVLAFMFAGLLGFAMSNINTAEIVGRSGDLTGRGEVWRQTWKLIMAEPLTGYGYGSIWFPDDATLWIQQSLTDFTWVVYHAHNGFLQVASEIGLPLSCIALLMVAQQLIEIFYCQYERQQVGVLFVLAFVVAYLISNFSEARFLVNRELYWIFFLALPISMLRQINIVSPDILEHDDTQEPYAVDPTAAGYGYAGVPPDKPWLRPIPQPEPARLGAQETDYGADETAISDDMHSDVSNAATRLRLSRIDNDPHDDTADRLVSNTDIDMGDLDVTSSGDVTLDTTQVITDHGDSIYGLNDDRMRQDSTARIDHSTTGKFDEFEDDRLFDDGHAADPYRIDDPNIEGDRYDKYIGDDDEWVDIPLDDDK